MERFWQGARHPLHLLPVVISGMEHPKAQVLKADNAAEIASVAQSLQSGQDKASQEYGRVLSQIVEAAPREKESILFGLNQQPAFRELVRKIKGEQETD